jgi:energy-coupling factor transport system ATP-binding protein
VYRLLGELTAPGSQRSIVLVEHDLDRALPIVDTVLVLDASGRPIAHGPAQEVLRDRAEELAALGVWLPTATLAALRLRTAGVPLAPLPLSGAELTEALAASEDPVKAAAGALAEVREHGTRRPTSGPVAAVRRLTLRRGRREVLRDISLEVRRGEFLAVAGPNGAGKSTLVQALAGLLRTPRGAVVRPSDVGFVFQNPEHQFVTAAVEDELAYGLRRRRLPETEVAQRVTAMLRTLGLEDHRTSHPFLLSGGQKRRLSVGTALIEGAPLLVLDEPTFGQDRARAADLLGLLADLNARGTTIVVVTHDLALAAEHADRVAIVDDGRLVALDTADRILRDRSLLEAHGLRLPPLVEALAAPGVPEPVRGIARLRDLPGAPAPAPSAAGQEQHR